MSKRRKLAWTGGVLVLAAAVTLFLVKDPLTMPGSHRVEVYGLNEEISGETQDPPGFLGRTLGMCDADTYYAQDGDKKLCLVLNGPLGQVPAARKDGKVTVAAADVPKLRQLAGEDTTLVLMAGGPAAVIPVAALTDGQPVSVSALS
ncbi:hypothetical protein M1L60_39200 [Actinoplanes sp. TRM 88003]|uniref:Uncharacterized protein n=1 Tax=Paractinoplanes aksuensis TaxID=2939490 RepID=A0ABT1E0M2_9ACTN|nr:hypothetical protein [Actinoplanes aksuensis]MCO8276623.1 hypothetical protein [Actinoplanes aksuensis]